jgi:hypothetical protein
MTTKRRDNRSPRSDRDRDERPAYSGPRLPRRSLDEEVVALRERGKSYSAIASTLGMKRATNANEAFVRAMRSLPEKDRSALQQREAGRLDQLEARIRSRDALEPEKMERHLVALEALRDTMK